MQFPTTVLVVSPDPEARQDYAALYASEGYRTKLAESPTAPEGLQEVDLVILDDRLYRDSTMDFCRRSAGSGGAPIIFVTSYADITDEIIALEIGADEVLGKPVDARLLLARSRALLRRRARSQPSPATPAWRLDPVVREATSPRGRRIRLAPNQLRLFHALLQQPGVVLSVSQLAELLDPTINDHSVAVRTAMSRLRRALESDQELSPVRNVRGGGYVFQPEDPPRTR